MPYNITRRQFVAGTSLGGMALGGLSAAGRQVDHDPVQFVFVGLPFGMRPVNHLEYPHLVVVDCRLRALGEEGRRGCAEE